MQGGSMRRFLSQKIDDFGGEDPASHNSLKVRLNNMALGNPLTDDDHDVLPSRCMKITLSAECIDRYEKQLRNAFYTALHSVQDQASSSDISLEASDSYAGSKIWAPRYHEGHLLSLRRCFRDTHKNDASYYFYIMWLSDYGELELPSRISRALLDAVRQNLPSMLDQEIRLFELLLLPYIADASDADFVRLLCPHEVATSFQEFEQMILNSYSALIAIVFHGSIPACGDHPILQLRLVLKSRLHLEQDEIQVADPNASHTKFIYRSFSEEEDAERQKKIQNEQRHLNEAKRPPYHETKEHVEELSDKDVCRFFFEGIPYGSVRKNVRSECTQRYHTLLQDSLKKFGSHAIACHSADSESLNTLQNMFQADFQYYVTTIIHSSSSIASESTYRRMSLHWKENSRFLHSGINFSSRKDVLSDMTDSMINQIINPTNAVQNDLSLKILISGPASSGKSTFLATAAQILSETLGKRSLIMVRYAKLDPQCKTVVGLLESVSSQIALLVPGSSIHVQMSAKRHLEDLSASILRLCAPSLRSSNDEEKIRCVLLIDDFDTLDADAVELIDSWIPVGFHPHFSIIATTSLDFMDKKLTFLRNSGLKREHVIVIPPFDGEVRSALIGSSTTKPHAGPHEPVEDIASIMANTGIFITKSTPTSRPHTSASVSISLHSEGHLLLPGRSFTDADICQYISNASNQKVDCIEDGNCDSLVIDDKCEEVLQSASEFKSFELAMKYLRSSTFGSIPKHINTAAFIQKTLDSAAEEFGVVFVSHLMAYLTFSRDHVHRFELLALLTCDEEVILEARNKQHDLYSGCATVKFPALIINNFLDTCILLQVMIPARGDVLICDCPLLIASWCCSQKGFDHKFIHSNMAIYFLGTWKSEGLPSQPLERELPPAPAQINFRRIREGPYHAILAGEFTLAGQEVARYSYIETCYRHGQGHEAAYYLKLLAGYIQSDPSKISDPDLPRRINDYWIFVNCNHLKLCSNFSLLSNLACSSNAASKIFEDAVANARYATEWSGNTKGFRLPRNSSIDNLRCFRSLPNIQGVPSLCISSNRRFAFVADNAGFLHKCELSGQRSHSKTFLFAIKRIVSICADQTGSSVMILYIDEVMRTTDIPETEAHINAHTCNLFTEWPQSICLASFSGTDYSLMLKTSTAGVVVHSLASTNTLTSVHIGGINFTDDFLSQCSLNHITAIRSSVSIVSDADGKFVLGAKDRVLEFYKESKILQAVTMDRPVLCVAISDDGGAACSLIIGSQVDLFTVDRTGLRWSHHAKLHFVSTVTKIAISSSCLYMLVALDNGCVQVWNVLEKKQRNRTNIAFDNAPVLHSDSDAKSSVSRSFVDDGPMENLISHGLVLFMALIENNDCFTSVVFDSSGDLGEWRFPYEFLKHPTAVIANRPSTAVYNSLSFNCGSSSSIIWANATSGNLTTLSSTGDLSVTSLSSGVRVAKTLLSSIFRINCVSAIEQSEFSVDPELRYVLGYQDGCIRLINRSWSCEFEGKVHHAAVTCIDTVARTHRTVSLIGFEDASLVLFDISSRARICTLPKQHTSSIASVQLYKDTGLSLGQDRQIAVWDLTLRRVKMVITSISNVVACSFALASTLVYSVSDDAKLRVHSTESHKERFSFYVNRKPTCMNVLQNGNKVVCGHQNGDVIVYNVQRRLMSFKLEGHASSVTSVFFVSECPFPFPDAGGSQTQDFEGEGSLKDFAMILSTSNDMSAIIWSPLLTSYQLNLWNSSVMPHAQIEANSSAINRYQARRKDVAAFPRVTSTRSGFKELSPNRSHQDVAVIQHRVQNCLRFADLRKGMIPEMPAAVISNALDPEKDPQASVSIFQSKHTRKLGKHTQQLVSLALESFKPNTDSSRNPSVVFGARGFHATERSPLMLKTASPFRHSPQKLLPQCSSPSDWIAALDKFSSDDES